MIAARRLVEPLRSRDFALLWMGMTASLLGDGVYTVAIAWQVYELSDAPTALSIVAVAWTIPQLLSFVLGGVVADRLDRRHVLVTGDALQAAAIGVIGLLGVTGTLRLWHVVALVPFVGVGQALFAPAFSALVPELVRADRLLQANALNQISRPLMLRLLGPALGGVLIGAFGTGSAFLVDAASFGASIAAVLAIAHRPALRRVEARRSVVRDVADGLRFVRSQPWLLGTLVASSAAMFFFLGPVYVLLPFVVKNVLGGSASDLGVVFAAGGAGAIAISLTLGGRGLPRRPLTLMYVAWALMCLQLLGYALAGALWQVVLVSFAGTALLIGGQILWSTVLQTLVPTALLGRVASLDALVSFGLVPASYALTGPVADALGVRVTLAGAAVLSAVVLGATLLLYPRLRELEERELVRGGAETEPASV